MTFTITIPNELEEEIKKKLKIKAQTQAPAPAPIKKKKVKKLVVNLKGAEQIKLKKIMVNGKKKLVPATETDEDKLYGIDLKRQQEIFKKEDLTKFNRHIKDLTDFFNRDNGVYKKALDIKSGKDLKEVYNSLLIKVKADSKIFIIPNELEVKIKKKLKM